MLLRAVVLVGALALGPAAGAQTPDCTCAAPSGNAVKELSRYTGVFAGRLTDVRDGRATFELLRTYKGPRGKLVTIAVAGACGNGSAAFEAGKAYLVYADGEKEALATGHCAPNRPLAQATGELRQLDLHTGQSANPLKLR